MFGLGATLGSLITWKLVEKKYKEIIEEEIAFGIKRLSNIDTDTEQKEEKVEKEQFAADKAIYTTIARDSGYYNDYTAVTEQEEVKNEDERTEPFVINPIEYGEKDDYETKSWTYYADFVMYDDGEEEIVSEPESIIGDALSHFGEYDDYAVYVRNDNLKCDYEILKHEKTFSEINGGE